MTIDYKHEVQLLSNGFWRPPEGETIVAVISELSDKKEIRYQGDDGRPEVQQKVDLNVQINGETHTWRVSVSHSQRSLYGQLVLLADKLGGLGGNMLKVIRQGSGRNTTYDIDPVHD